MDPTEDKYYQLLVRGGNILAEIESELNAFTAIHIRPAAKILRTNIEQKELCIALALFEELIP